MSLKQRRDHRPIVGVDSEGAVACVECGDPLVEVFDHYTRRYSTGPVLVPRHWRHVRRHYRGEPIGA